MCIEVRGFSKGLNLVGLERQGALGRAWAKRYTLPPFSKHFSIALSTENLFISGVSCLLYPFFYMSFVFLCNRFHYRFPFTSCTWQWMTIQRMLIQNLWFSYQLALLFPSIHINAKMHTLSYNSRSHCSCLTHHEIGAPVYLMWWLALAIYAFTCHC